MKTTDKILPRKKCKMEVKLKKKKIYVKFTSLEFEEFSRTFIFNKNDTFLLDTVYMDVLLVGETVDYT